MRCRRRAPSRPSISPSSTFGSMTTPLPMTGVQPGVRTPAGHQVQRVLLAVRGDHGVAGVVAALVAHDVRHPAAEQVGHLALALVAPLGADQHDRWHRWGLLVRRTGRSRLARWQGIGMPARTARPARSGGPATALPAARRLGRRRRRAVHRAGPGPGAGRRPGPAVAHGAAARGPGRAGSPPTTPPPRGWPAPWGSAPAPSGSSRWCATTTAGCCWPPAGSPRSASSAGC